MRLATSFSTLRARDVLVWTLLAWAVVFIVLQILLGIAGAGFILALFIITLMLLLSAALAATHWRWAPAIGIVLGVVIWIGTLSNPYGIDHVTHPGEFGFFLLFALFLALGTVTIISGAAAIVEAVRGLDRPLTGGMRYTLTAIGGLTLGAIIASGIASTHQASAAASIPPATVHLTSTSFSLPAVIVPKGSSLHVIPDTGVAHILQNGTWNQGHADSVTEPGAPTIQHVVTGSSPVDIGPFTTAGTYHIYCTVHPGMQLTVVVE